MTKSSLMTMFGRLPTHHQRPAPSPVATAPTTTIGEPVLTQTSNERLSGHAGGARPRTSPYERLAPTDFAKVLPQIPSCTFDDVEEAVTKGKGAEPSPPASRTDPRDRSYSQSSPAPYHHHHPRLRNYNIVRKPAPPLPPPPPPPATVPPPAALGTAGGGSGDGGGGYGGINNTGGTSGGEDYTSNARSFMSTSKGSGFTLGNLVKERIGRRPKPAPSAHAHPAGAPGDRLLPDDDNDDNDLLAPTAIRPVGLNSIDDWLDSRQSLHKRSATASSKSTQFTAAVAPSPELTIRQSTFAPLRAPPHLLPSETSHPPQPPPSPPPAMPIIPAFFRAKSLPPVPPVPPPPPPATPPRQSPLPGGTGSYSDRPLPPIMAPESPLHRHHPVQQQQREQHRQQLLILQQQQRRQQQQQQQEEEDQKRQQQPEQQQQQQQQQQGPRDHLSRLEDEQQQLDSQKTRLVREICEVEGKMGSSRATREQFRPHLDELQSQYADLEKASHELGLKLCRAYRRRDLRAGTEGPTHLWVSRVTAPLEE